MSEGFVHVTSGMIVPLGAYLAVLQVERAGHQLWVEGDQIVVRTNPGAHLDPALVTNLTRWKAHAIMLLGYEADDSHLRDAPAAQPPVRALV